MKRAFAMSLVTVGMGMGAITVGSSGGQAVGTVLAADSIRIKGTVTRIVLKSVDTPPTTLMQRVTNLPARRGLFLIFEGYRVEVPPMVAYRVLLGDVDGLTENEVGRLTFRRTSGSSEAPFASFDITSVAKILKAKGKLMNPTIVTVEPLPGVRPDTAVVVTKVLLMEQPVATAYHLGGSD